MRLFYFILAAVFVFTCCGCAGGPVEFGKQIFGFSTKALEDNRDTGVSKTFDKSFDACYQAVRDALTKMNASVFVEKYHNHLVVALGFEGALDTTEVGIFFDEVTDNKTIIDIVSFNRALQIKVSDEVFAFLDVRFKIEPTTVEGRIIELEEAE